MILNKGTLILLAVSAVLCTQIKPKPNDINSEAEFLQEVAALHDPEFIRFTSRYIDSENIIHDYYKSESNPNAYNWINLYSFSRIKEGTEVDKEFQLISKEQHESLNISKGYTLSNYQCQAVKSFYENRITLYSYAAYVYDDSIDIIPSITYGLSIAPEIATIMIPFDDNDQRELNRSFIKDCNNPYIEDVFTEYGIIADGEGGCNKNIQSTTNTPYVCSTDVQNTHLRDKKIGHIEGFRANQINIKNFLTRTGPIYGQFKAYSLDDSGSQNIINEFRGTILGWTTEGEDTKFNYVEEIKNEISQGVIEVQHQWNTTNVWSGEKVFIDYIGDIIADGAERLRSTWVAIVLVLTIPLGFLF